jgi:hypothetical protein
MITNIDAIRSLAPGASYSIIGDEIVWNSPNIPQPTQEEIDAEIARLQAEYDSQEYARNRKEEYPTTDELIVALWEAVIEERMASSIDLQGKRTAIKEKYPK